MSGNTFQVAASGNSFVNIGDSYYSGDPKRVALHNALLPNWQSSNSLRLDWDHQQARKKHVGNTGKWLLDSEQFQLWLSERNSFMWLHGIAGSGKTVMSSTIIDYLQNSLTGGTCTAGYYFSAVEEEKRNVSRLLRSLLLQFCPAEGELPPKVEELHNRCLSQQLTFSEEFLLEVIEDLVKGERHTYIIVDALDECDASFQSGEESEAEKLVKLITRLTSVPELNVHLLVTSRDGGLTSVVDHELRRLAEESVGNGSFRHVIDLQAGEMSHRVHDDIKEFLCYELKRWNNRRGRLWLPLDEERRSLVADSIENRANGMFRLVACLLDLLWKKGTWDELKSALNDLPPELPQVYSRILENIKTQGQMDTASTLLRWLLYSKRPLNLAEATEITMVNSHDTSFNIELGAKDQSYISYTLSSFIVISEDNLVQFAHKTVADYLLLDTTECGLFARAGCSHFITNCCLSYIQFWSQADLRCRHERHYVGHRCSKDYILLEYALNNWYRHAREGVWLARQHAREIRISSMNRKMVEPPPNVDAIHEATTQPTELRDPANNSPARMCNSEFNNNSQSISEWAASTKLCLGQIVRGERTMHTDDDWQALASKGYEKFVDFMLSTTPSAISFHGASMLAILTSALARDYKRMALLIIDSTSKREESDTSGAYEMLDLAIKELEPEGFDPGVSHETIVGLILKHAVDLNLKGLKRWTGLHLAASQGYDAIVNILLEAGVDVNCRDPIGRTALHVSSSQGHDLVTQLLLANGADNSLRDHAGWTALNHAVLEAAKSLNQSVPEPKMPLSKQERLVQTMRLLSDKHHRTDICNTETLEQTRENTLDGRGSTILGCMFHEIVIQNVATNTTVTAVFVQSFTLYRGSVRFRIPLIQHLLLNGGFGIDSLMMNRELRQNPWVIDSTSTYFENVNIYGGAVSFSFAKVKNLSVYGGSVTFSSPVLIGSVAIYGGSVTFSAAARIRQLFVYRGHANILGQSQIKSASLYDGFTNFRRSQVGSLHIYAGSVNFLSPAQINDLLIYGGVVNFTYETRRELMELLGELDVEDRLSCSDMVTQIGNLRIMDSGHFVFAVDGQIGQIKVDGGVASFHTGSTALQKAIKYGYQPIARLLLEKGANPNSFISPQSRTGKIWQTALHIAAFLGYEEMVQLLLEYGADTDLKNYQGQTAMQIAERQGNATIVQLLHEHKPNASGDWTGRGVQTTLHMVAERISNAVKAAPWHWIPGCA